MKLALYTFGIFKKPANDPANDGFYELNDPVFEIVDNFPGFIARSGYEGEDGPPSWGKETYPEFYVEKGDGWTPATLSIWEDIESIFKFTYFGLHKEALKRGSEWNVKPEWPPYAMWWHESGKNPEWKDAVDRHKYLHDNGPTFRAFNFKKMFDPSGEIIKIDMDRVKEINQL